MNIIAHRLLISRRDTSFTQVQLAEAAELSPQYVSNIERGRTTNVGIDAVESLARVLGVAPAYLVGWSDIPDPDADNPASIAEDRVVYELRRPEDRLFFQELLEVVARLDSEQRRQVLALARTWASERTAEAAYQAAIGALAGPAFVERLTGLLDAGGTLTDVNQLLDELRQDIAQQRKPR